MPSAPATPLAEPLATPADVASGWPIGAARQSLRQLVARPRLVERLSESSAPLVVLRAPGGYGKSALLAQWAASDERAFTWIGLGDAGDDPTALLDALARQLDGLSPPSVLVLDDAQLVGNAGALALVADVAVRQRPGSTIALATRGEPALPLGRLRVQGVVLELGAEELALTADESARLLCDAGVALEAAELATLRERTEGWPAGLRLAALALRDQPDVHAAAARFGGDDRFVADYLRDAMLKTLAPGEAQFLRHVAPLGELTGPLCDAALARSGSGALLRSLARADLLVTAVDRGEHRFHVHPLLADMLAAELRCAEPEVERRVHRRASAWHAADGDRGRAIHHAMSADDFERAGELLWSVAGAYAMGGRVGELSEWITQVDDDRLLAHPTLALSAAVERLAVGDRDAAERWLDAAEHHLSDAADAEGAADGQRLAVDGPGAAPQRPADGRRPAAGGPRSTPDELAAASMRAGLMTLRAALARGGAEALLADAGRAREAAGDGPWRAPAALIEGAAWRLMGAPGRAKAVLAAGVREGAVPTPAARACALALLALGELEGGSADAALGLVGVAVGELEPRGLEADPGCALVNAVAGFVRANAGDLERARAHVDRGRRLLAELADPAPWYAAETRIALARALLRLSDAAAARELLTDAGRVLRALPDAPGLRDRLDEAWERADSFAIDAVAGPSALTIAELRVLRFLPSHLSFREIAATLHVSANTVKTQAHAVYRKLDASSRSEAVARARLIGLIDG